MLLAMLGFAVDFGARKTGIKATGILILRTFVNKIGSGLGAPPSRRIMNSLLFPTMPRVLRVCGHLAFIWAPALLSRSQRSHYFLF